ncbi:MAG TPA: DUF4282 domain-containing protein [Kiritimatiellia bacterium]|nr:DUF4282 domain-containing protein [Kiritimatiellia bacterium]HRZ12822.1 DUF4282 domain-containing protein [Kiritimatiellia bacterium]HSA18226.1 DUF4282 domain-containing protein [Kiritimatiellia bacterium]
MEEKSFLETLFDLSFTEFVTTRLIKVVYVIGIIGAALAGLQRVYLAFRFSGFGSGLLSLVVTPILFLVVVLLIRIWCEMIIAVFRIAENTGRLAEAQKSKAP